VKILDGNAIEASEHRLKDLRATASGALPGKSLVVFDPRLRMPIEVFPGEDGHAQERSLLADVLSTAGKRTGDEESQTVAFWTAPSKEDGAELRIGKGHRL